ncbi:hypothetical protein [Rhodovulum marinum]|uniref:Uncharacterized protein n=1 Tax=Rhodovulum marinum TaxID=320662 RepID=A0A4R2Q123_9RHOB|nr:hypothetical protein [Rhodovulum marinum]TCP42303.1 hypothetical protein EV662_103210 [Rhodovulum marinum]
MSHCETSSRIVAFASQCGAAQNPIAAARSRGWLDEKGRPTRDGRVLVDALGRNVAYGVYRLVG